MSGTEQELAALGGLAIGLAWRNRDWLFHKPTDWNDVRERMGYEARPDAAPPPKPLPEPKQRWLLGFWARAVDWDAERRRLGYSMTIDARPVRGSKRRAWH